MDAATAEKMHGIFLEIIIAPSYTAEALAILTNKKKNLRILGLAFDAQAASGAEKEVTGVLGGLLVQNQDVIEENPADWQVVTKRQPTEQERVALEFAWKSVKYVKSNGIIITNDRQCWESVPVRPTAWLLSRLLLSKPKIALTVLLWLLTPSSLLRTISKKSQPLASSYHPACVDLSVMRIYYRG